MVEHFGLWTLPVVTFAVSALWVCWPRPDEWRSNGDYTAPDGIIYAPARAALGIIATLIAVVIWRW